MGGGAWSASCHGLAALTTLVGLACFRSALRLCRGRRKNSRPKLDERIFWLGALANAGLCLFWTANGGQRKGEWSLARARDMFVLATIGFSASGTACFLAGNQWHISTHKICLASELLPGNKKQQRQEIRRVLTITALLLQVPALLSLITTWALAAYGWSQFINAESAARWEFSVVFRVLAGFSALQALMMVYSDRFFARRAQAIILEAAEELGPAANPHLEESARKLMLMTSFSTYFPVIQALGCIIIAGTDALTTPWISMLWPVLTTVSMCLFWAQMFRVFRHRKSNRLTISVQPMLPMLPMQPSENGTSALVVTAGKPPVKPSAEERQPEDPEASITASK